MTLDECGCPTRRHGAGGRHHSVSPSWREWFWASYTAVYLGVPSPRTSDRKTCAERTRLGFSQSLAYHGVRRQVAEMSVDLETPAAVTYHSAWLSDTAGPTPATVSAALRAKYFVGEAVTRSRAQR